MLAITDVPLVNNQSNYEINLHNSILVKKLFHNLKILIVIVQKEHFTA